MNRMLLTLGLLAALAAACTPQNEIELTLVAQNVALNTQIAAVRQTATVDADRLQVTVEYMNTLVAQAQEQRSQLQATLIARGADPAAVGVNITPLALQTTPLPAAEAASAPGAVVVPPPAPGDVPVTPFSAENAPVTSAAPTLANIVTATGVGQDDCAVGVTSVFSASSERIYVVATAYNIQPGTLILSRWFQEGRQVVTHDFTPNFQINDACIWFFIDQTDAPFTPGNWAVDLEINGAVVGPSTRFSVQ